MAPLIQTVYNGFEERRRKKKNAQRAIIPCTTMARNNDDEDEFHSVARNVSVALGGNGGYVCSVAVPDAAAAVRTARMMANLEKTFARATGRKAQPDPAMQILVNAAAPPPRAPAARGRPATTDLPALAPRRPSVSSSSPSSSSSCSASRIGVAGGGRDEDAGSAKKRKITAKHRAKRQRIIAAKKMGIRCALENAERCIHAEDCPPGGCSLGPSVTKKLRDRAVEDSAGPCLKRWLARQLVEDHVPRELFSKYLRDRAPPSAPSPHERTLRLTYGAITYSAFEDKDGVLLAHVTVTWTGKETKVVTRTLKDVTRAEPIEVIQREV